MRPSGVRSHSKKGWQIAHICERCGAEKVNRAAPDDMDALIELMKQGVFY
jgi:hypothetical protein